MHLILNYAMHECHNLGSNLLDQGSDVPVHVMLDAKCNARETLR